MTASGLLASLSAALAVVLAFAPRTRPFRAHAPAVVLEERSALKQHRRPLALLAGVGAAAFVGGWIGLLAGAPAGLLAWRALGRVESPAVLRLRARLAHDLPGAVDLLVAAFDSGAAPGPALAMVGTALGGPVGTAFAVLERRLGLGTDPAEVWRDLTSDPQLGPLGRALGRAHETGSSVTTAAQRLAAELRERAQAEVESRARSVSTKAAVPLGACFLPAFVLLGIVPLVAGLVGSLGFFG